MNENTLRKLWGIIKGHVYYVQGERQKLFITIGVIFLVSMLFLIYLMRKSKKISRKKLALRIGLMFECMIILMATLLGRCVMLNSAWRWRPLESYVKAISEQNLPLLAQIIWNIILFIPFGMLLPGCFKVFEQYRKVFAAVLLTSSIIEMIQGCARIGTFETDDIISNVIGTAIGVMLYRIYKCRKIKEKYGSEIK